MKFLSVCFPCGLGSFPGKNSFDCMQRVQVEWKIHKSNVKEPKTGAERKRRGGGGRSRAQFILQWVNYCNKYVQFCGIPSVRRENRRRSSKTMEIVAFSSLGEGRSTMWVEFICLIYNIIYNDRISFISSLYKLKIRLFKREIDI